MGILSVIAHIVCLGLFAYAAVHDIRTRTIPNWCNIAIAAVGLVAWLLGLDIPANGGVVLGDRLMGAVLCGGPFLLATLGGAAIGAGDGKFLAAAGFVLGMRYGFAGLAVGVLAEEPLTAIDFDCPRNIKVRDRATLFNLLIGLDGYTICSGVISHKLNGRNIIARQLDVHDKMTIGYVMRKGVTPSRYAKAYIAALMRHCK